MRTADGDPYRLDVCPRFRDILTDRIRPTGRKPIYPRFAPVGDSALTVEFDDAIDPKINARVQALDRAIAVSNLPGIVETVPSFRSLTILYEPEAIDLESLTEKLLPLLDDEPRALPVVGRSWTIPVAYGFPDADDLREICELTGLSRDEVEGLHSGAEHLVFLIGFVPGMPILGGLPEPLHVPRRPEPRPDIPAGRVMIAGMQGQIVPMPMLTGWRSLGQTPVRPYEPGAANPFLFRAGDRIRFRPIGVRELDALAGVPGGHFLNSRAA
jgi:KipI family sensor histidine kinase inhibitor